MHFQTHSAPIPCFMWHCWGGVGGGWMSSSAPNPKKVSYAYIVHTYNVHIVTKITNNNFDRKAGIVQYAFGKHTRRAS